MSRLLKKVSSLRTRYLIQYRVSMSAAVERDKPSPSRLSPSPLSPCPETKDQAIRREYVSLNIKKLTQEPTKEQLVMDILNDFVEKRKGVYTFKSELQDLLFSDRLKDLGVGYKKAPIPDINEWKASWFEEGKPKWLGTCPTDADGRFFYTASITGYLDKEGGKGGYGVIFFDIYGRPKVASVGVSQKGYVPLIYYELQGVRSALQLALDYGFSSGFSLYCNSREVWHVLDLCLESAQYVPMCMADAFLRHDASLRSEDAPICNACVGYDLYDQLADFDLLYPVVNEILTLFSKLQSFRNVSLSKCCASSHLAKLYGMSTAEEMGVFKLPDNKQELYEMVLKPDKFPEEVDGSLYDEAFKGGRIHTRNIIHTEATAGMDPVKLYQKLTAHL